MIAKASGATRPMRVCMRSYWLLVRVQTPTKLNERQRKALEEFARASGEEPTVPEEHGDGGLFEWVRNIFGGKDHAGE